MMVPKGKRLSADPLQGPLRDPRPEPKTRVDFFPTIKQTRARPLRVE